MNAPDQWLDAESIAGLIEETAQSIAKRYNIQAAPAKDIVRGVFAGSAELRRLVESHMPAATLRRTRACKDAVAEGKRRVYYHLRRYHDAGPFPALVEQLESLGPSSPDERERLATAIAGAHKSTAERLPCLDELHRHLSPHYRSARSILDVGCGVYPLVFPFQECSDHLERYVAVDKDALALRAVRAYAKARNDDRIVAIQWDLEAGWDLIARENGDADFDLALMLKLVPVIDRQQRGLLPLLAECPARTWVLSGSRSSMTKRESIERREKAVLQRFVESTGRRKTAELIAGNEIAWTVEPGGP